MWRGDGGFLFWRGGGPGVALRRQPLLWAEQMSPSVCAQWLDQGLLLTAPSGSGVRPIGGRWLGPGVWDPRAPCVIPADVLPGAAVLCTECTFPPGRRPPGLSLPADLRAGSSRSRGCSRCAEVRSPVPFPPSTHGVACCRPRCAHLGAPPRSSSAGRCLLRRHCAFSTWDSARARWCSVPVPA